MVNIMGFWLRFVKKKSFVGREEIERKSRKKKICMDIIKDSYNDSNYYSKLFFTLICTQEEIRHYLDVRFMLIIGKLAHNLGVDVAKLDTRELIEKLWERSYYV